MLVEGRHSPMSARLDNEAGLSDRALRDGRRPRTPISPSHGSALRYRELVAQCASPDVAGLLQSLHGEGAIPEAAYRQALDVLRPQLQAAVPRSLPRARRRRDRLSDHAAAGRADRRRRDGAAERRARADLLRPSSAIRSPGSVAGIPGISLPAAMTAAGLPLGIELDGAEGSDARLLAIAPAVEARAAEAAARRRATPTPRALAAPIARRRHTTTRRRPMTDLHRTPPHPFRRRRQPPCSAPALRPAFAQAKEFKIGFFIALERAGGAVRADAAGLRRPRRREDQQGRRHPRPARSG